MVQKSITDEEILVTVICMAYNHEKYIRDALEGFIMQDTSFRFEVIVHDDASTDGTADIIREYEKLYPEVIHGIYEPENQFSKGAGCTSILIRNAKGKYIAICEGDDYWTDSQKLTLQVEALEKHPQCSGSYHNTTVVDQDKRKIEGKIQLSHLETISGIRGVEGLVYQCRYGRTASIMMRRSIFSEMDVNKWNHYIKCEANGDMKWSALMAAHGGIYYIARDMANYRYVVQGSGSWNARNYGKNINLITFHALESIRKFIKEDYDVSIDYSGYYSWLVFNSFKQYMKKKNKENMHVMVSLISENKEKWKLFIMMIKLVLRKIHS